MASSDEMRGFVFFVVNVVLASVSSTVVDGALMMVLGR